MAISFNEVIATVGHHKHHLDMDFWYAEQFFSSYHPYIHRYIFYMYVSVWDFGFLVVVFVWLFALYIFGKYSQCVRIDVRRLRLLMPPHHYYKILLVCGRINSMLWTIARVSFRLKVLPFHFFVRTGVSFALAQAQHSTQKYFLVGRFVCSFHCVKFQL